MKSRERLLDEGIERAQTANAKTCEELAAIRLEVEELKDQVERLAPVVMIACMVVDMDPAEPEFEIARNELRIAVDECLQRGERSEAKSTVEG